MKLYLLKHAVFSTRQCSSLFSEDQIDSTYTSQRMGNHIINTFTPKAFTLHVYIMCKFEHVCVLILCIVKSSGIDLGHIFIN
jgi:hypothetical protein